MISLGQIAAGLMLPVFPCNDRKRPIVEGGFYAATDDPSAVHEAFDKPHASMIGVPTGGRSGLVVLDVDIKHGRAGMAWLEANAERLPATRTHRTQSGGLHLLFRWPGVPIRNSASSIADGIDVRGDGGYIIYPGSPGYAVADDSPVAAMPAWLLDLVAPQQPQRVAQPPQPLRMDGGTSYGRKALEDECNGVRAAGWGSQEHTLNSAGLKIGALIAGGELDAGPATAELLAAGRSMASQPGQPPWTSRDIEDKVRRAIRDGQSVPRSAPPKTETYRPEPPMPPDDSGYWASVEADAAMSDWAPEADAPHVAAAETKDTPPIFINDEAWDEATLPVRPWVAKGYLMRRSVSVLAGIGSGGKSGLAVCWSLALVFDRAWSRLKPNFQCRVSLYNAEDDDDEQRLRLSAALRQFGRSSHDLTGRLYRIGPSNVGTLIERDPATRTLRFTPAMEHLIRHLEEVRPDVLILDPLIAIHNADENDNTAIRSIMATFRALAVRFNMAVLLAHHVRKGSSASPGDADVIRGGSDIVGASRVALTLTVMTDEEAKELGIQPDTRREYFRVDGAKQNYAAISVAEWFKRFPYQLANGEIVVAVEPWAPPNMQPSGDLVRMALDGIAAGYCSAPWSPRMSDEPRSFRALAMRLGVDNHAAQKALLEDLLNRHGVQVGDCPKSARKSKSETMRGLRTSDGAPHNVEWVS